MRRSSLASLAALFAAIVLTAAPAGAQNHAFVSLSGSDANNCNSPATACLSFFRAHAQTSLGGTIRCMDYVNSVDFFTITKSITIDCAGTGSSTIGFTDSAIIIDAPGADIHIRGLKIFSHLGAIRFASTGAAALVRIEDSDLSTVPSANVIAVNNGASPNLLKLILVNTTLSRGVNGLLIRPNGGGAWVTLDNVRLVNNTRGIRADGTGATHPTGLRVTVKNSAITGNTSQGILVESTNGTTRVHIKDSVVTHNDVGIQADGPSAVTLASGSAITQNNFGLSAINGGRNFTFGTNDLVGNLTSNGAFDGVLAQQ